MLALSSNSSSNATSSSRTIFGIIAANDNLIIFAGLFILIIGTVFLTGLFETSAGLRNNILFNTGFTILVGALFIYLVFSFMGRTVTVFQFKIDYGLILFITLGIVIIFIIGD